jgi:hypothetical protein
MNELYLQLIDELLVVGRGRDETADEEECPTDERRRLPKGPTDPTPRYSSPSKEPFEISPN